MDLKQGECYEVVQPFRTPANKNYRKGDVLMLIEPTGQSPFGWRAEKGTNWIVKCKHFQPPSPESVWSCIQYLANNGWIRKITTKLN
jgi:hypothetical protein